MAVSRRSGGLVLVKLEPLLTCDQRIRSLLLASLTMRHSLLRNAVTFDEELDEPELVMDEPDDDDDDEEDDDDEDEDDHEDDDDDEPGDDEDDECECANRWWRLSDTGRLIAVPLILFLLLLLLPLLLLLLPPLLKLAVLSLLLLLLLL